MAEPKQKLSRSRRAKRQSTQKLKNIKLITCNKCKTKIPSHRACPVCGFYKGKETIKISTVSTKVKSKSKKEGE